MLFDSHTHINNDDYTDAGRRELIREIAESDVELVMDIGYDWPSTVQSMIDASVFDRCYSVIGIHPHDTKSMTEEQYEDLKKLAQGVKITAPEGFEMPDEETAELLVKAAGKVKAIGEIGLDYHYDLSPRDDQRYWFRRQIRLANELGLPIVVHAREADQEVMNILIEEGAFSEERKKRFGKRPAPQEKVKMEIKDSEGKVTAVRELDFSDCTDDARVDIHCFSGSRELAVEYIRLGATIGVDGPLTYKNNKKTVSVVETIPLEFIMVETDAPYLTPVPFRGRPNKSPYVKYVAQKVAEIKGLSYEEVCRMTYENGRRFFGI